jgi:ELWxxDGT repeat protein
MKTSFWRGWWQWARGIKPACRASRRRPRRPALCLEVLEDRTLLSGTPQMVLDINPGPFSSNPSQTVAIGSTTYFSANDGVHGKELWKSDGTAAGTTMVADISPESGPGLIGSYPSYLTNVNGTLFFAANDGAHGVQLWKSDGTAAGTTMVADINGSAGASPRYLTNVNGTLFFSANDSTHGTELWKSDGTAAGTTPLADIGANSYPSNLTNVNGTLFFSTNGSELWKSDGTAAGTTLLADIGAGSYPSNLTNVNGTLFFSTSGSELWKSDGTAAGTTVLADLGAYSYPSQLTNVNSTLFFAADDGTDGTELWKSDGTAAGTVMVKDISPGSGWHGGGYYAGYYGPNSSYPRSLTNVNGTLFFSATDGAHGRQLWKSDGTATGTTLVADINGSAGSYPDYLTNVNGTLFFSANDGTHGRELWKSDGTAAGTTLVADINPGTAGSYPYSLTNANGSLFFTANDGVHGDELWVLYSGPSLAVSAFPANPTAGVPGSFTVKALNPDGSADAGYTGTVHFTSSDLQAVLPADYTFTAADQGTHTFTATLKTAGHQSITVTDTQTPRDNGTEQDILVQSAAASTLIIGGFPSSTTAGVAGNLTVTLKDAYGNIATGYTGTVHFSSTDARASLPANYAFTSGDAGMHTFRVTLKTAGTQSITATDTTTASLTSTVGGVMVNPAAASQFIIRAPSGVTHGVAFSLTVTVEDAYGNLISGYTGTIHFSSTDSTATLPADYTFTTADKGVHTFTGLILRKKGKQKITITDTLNSSLTASVSENVG